MSTWVYTILSVFAVSLISLVGIFTFSIKSEKLSRILIFLVSFSAGTLLGDAFIHLIPESFQDSKNNLISSLGILLGILVFFILEKIIHWRHCHEVACENHPHPFSYMILVGDSIHNFIDGMVIAASFLVSIPVGIATTIAVIFHEIPQEIGDFGSLVFGGFSKAKALLMNLLTALWAVLGAILVLALNFDSQNLVRILIPFAAGGFIYIASSDLIPELKKHESFFRSLAQILVFILGIGMMIGLTYLE